MSFSPKDGFDKKPIAKKLILLGVLSTICILGLGIRLFYIQIVKHDLFLTEVNKQRSLTIPINSGRSYFFDRSFIPLTDRTEEAVAIIFPQLFKTNEDSLKVLEEITKIPTYKLEEKISSSKEPLEFNIIGEIDSNSEKIIQTRGLFIVNKRLRYSQSKPLLTHVLGYYNRKDNSGMYGLEKSLNEVLINSDLKTIGAIVDGKKRLLPGEGYYFKSQKEGIHVQLTIDYPIQSIVEEVLDKYNYRGAVIISEVETGEILALASRPTFDPNNIDNHLKSSGDELYNKALQMTFPPGSIFKLVVTAEGLEERMIDLNEIYNCSGSETIGNTKIRCSSHERGGHGDISFIDSFAESCNSTFIKIGQELGPTNILDMARRFGFGEKVDIGLEEERGNLPSGDYIRGPAIGNISIGQGDIEVTPLQINQFTQILANDGVKKKLSLIKGFVDDNYGLIESMEIKDEEFIISKDIASILQQLMHQVMVEGTGKAIGELSEFTAGKTGSAESTERGEKVLHGWFTGYYPLVEPRYAVTVLIQNGGFGSQAAVPVFRDIIEKIIEGGIEP
ncbi:hypothetical protein F8154_03410 [Alkaliphilus pronyensis]|uniref:Penicillin-binding protein transpeptidase domain-containing protein n=1 Tax=Alkaliphilus pronyensis TaxID=1482732 RepID=A0A6I0F374_9FIRM|nr:penicillin-binding transpeptidase domain-containing protein [Alkaliphilus pronyensis]KAB3537351.1 hypothetical protein F8154_03410 [Alkaliphilus pronyensis]